MGGEGRMESHVGRMGGGATLRLAAVRGGRELGKERRCAGAVVATRRRSRPAPRADVAQLRPSRRGRHWSRRPLSLSATFRCFPLFRPACLQLPPRPAAPVELVAGHGTARGVTGPASREARAGGAGVPRRAVHEACRPPAWTPR